MEFRRLAGRNIEAYGEGRFRIAGQIFSGSILIAAGGIFPWAVESWAGHSAETIFESLTPLLGEIPRAEILLIGCGVHAEMLPAALRTRLRQAGLIAETMDTGAACRTYNVLIGEDRSVAAALVAV